MNGKLPIYYDYANVLGTLVTPGEVKDQNNLTAAFFRRYLLQKIFSVFEFTLPEEWKENYFLYVLFCNGYIAVVNTDKYGVIPQHCSLKGYGVQYQPTQVLVANPLLRGTLEPYIDKQCALIQLQPDYNGVMDIVSYYAGLMATACEALNVNLINSKIAYIFAADSKSVAESFKKLMDKINSGVPAVVADKELFNEEGELRVELFNRDIKNSFISLDILEALAKLDNRFNTLVGIPNSNYEKKERLITDEVNANNSDTEALALGWLKMMNKGIKKANELFPGLNLSVRYRYKQKTEGENNDTDNDRRTV